MQTIQGSGQKTGIRYRDVPLPEKRSMAKSRIKGHTLFWRYRQHIRDCFPSNRPKRENVGIESKTYATDNGHGAMAPSPIAGCA